jgi:hypothetical protein
MTASIQPLHWSLPPVRGSRCCTAEAEALAARGAVASLEASRAEGEVRAEALRRDPKKDPKLLGTLRKLVLLREPPTKWDRVRTSVFQT